MDKSIGQLMDEKPMVSSQWGVIALCILINMLDGFDVLVMAFTAASVSADWGLNGIRVGYLLSAGLVGMAIGSLFIAPWADRFGRRPLIMLCVSIAGLGMLASSQANSFETLAILRLITGLGIGGVLASSYVIAGEYANKKWRGLAISLQSTAYALGATIGGIIAAQIIPTQGWRSVFLYGGITTLSTLPLLFLWLPESLAFLTSRQPVGALAKINKLLVRVKLNTISALPTVNDTSRARMRDTVAELFSPALLRSTLLIWLAFFLVMFGFYFVLSWTPRLLVSAGLSNAQGITGGVLLNMGGIVGTTVIGLLAARYPLARLLMLYLIINALLLALFVQFTHNLTLAFAVALAIGVFVNGCVAGLYALAPSFYSASQRVTGLGWGIGMGRIGAILSPLVAGHLIDANWSPSKLYILFASAFVLAALVVWGLKRRATARLAPASAN
ncbi:MFS transporter [Pseudomonas sp. LJDD11]|uniref:MFS transporter n=1 Tax=unclassified Pseudomonas TaxID=196821 RepID=UPI0004F66BAF|nr:MULTISPECIES: MFS transporter [unclassified Pseudomonas]MCQ9426194.1 MFS transporter [Pseudomonas sp. LJDD11]BAP41558.1 major facilitator transporter [Pseudomonas sp. StFLB209]